MLADIDWLVLIDLDTLKLNDCDSLIDFDTDVAFRTSSAIF